MLTPQRQGSNVLLVDGGLVLPMRCRAAPLTSVAQVLSKLFGHADLTVSDLVAALVLTAAAQHQRRRLHIKNALAPTLEAMSESQANGDNDMGARACSGTGGLLG